MPEELRDRLAKAAADNGHGIGEEMRRRLEASFAGSVPTAADPKSAELLRLIADVLRWINERCALWHESAYAHATLKAAFAALLEPYRPEGEAVPPKADGLFSSPPEQEGWVIAEVATLM